MTTHLCKETDLSSRSWPPAPRSLGYSVSVHSVLRWQHRPLRSGALREVLILPLRHTALSLPPDPALASGLCFASRPATQPLPNCPFRRVPAPATPLSHHATPLTSSLLRHSNLATPFVHLPAPPRHCRLRPCLLPAPPQKRAPLLPRWGPLGVVRGPGAACGPTSEGRRCGTVPLFSRPGATAPFLRVSASLLGVEAGEAGVGSKEL